jgi:hypothetical protein
MQNIQHFAKKHVPSNMVKGIFWKLKKKNPYLKEKNYEIAKIFGGF